MVKEELSPTAGTNAVWFNSIENHVNISHKIIIELPYDSAILLPGIYPVDTKIFIQEEICTALFIILFNILTKIRNLSRCPITDKLIIRHGMHTH